MSNYKEINFGKNPLNLIVGLVVLIVVMLGLFRLANLIFQLLYYVAPILLIAALVLDHKVVIGYGKWVVSLLNKNPIMGIGAILMTIFGFPVVTAFLLGKILFKRQVSKVQKAATEAREGELVDFEELDSKPLDLPEVKRKESEYDDLL